MRWIGLACIGLTVIGAALPAAHLAVAQERALGVKRLVFELEVDVAKAREQNWAGKGASDEELVALGSRLVQRRFDAMQRAAKIELEPGTKRFKVSLPSIDSRDHELFVDMLNSIGLCEFLFAAETDSAQARGIDLAAEQAKLDAWRKPHADETLVTFNLLAADGPARGLAWFETSFGDKPCPPIAVLLPDEAANLVGAGSFERVSPKVDLYGYPAFGFELRASRTEDFARITGANVNRRMVILLGYQIVSAPTLSSKLSGSGLIEGRFSGSEVEHWVEALQKLEGPLRVIESR